MNYYLQNQYVYKRLLLPLLCFLCYNSVGLFGQSSCDNRCLDFDGLNDFVQTTVPLSGNQPFTIEMWFNSTNTLNGTCNNNSLADFRWLVSWDDNNFGLGDCNGSLRLVYKPLCPSGTGLCSSLAPIPINDGKWHHIAITKSATGMSVYFDGSLFTGLDVSNYDVAGFLRLGSSGTGNVGRTWAGQIDEFRLWNQALSATQIKDEMLCKLAGNEAGLVIYYDFNQGLPDQNNAGVNTASDLALPQEIGTLTNFTLNGNASNWRCSNSQVTTPCVLNYVDSLDSLYEAGAIYVKVKDDSTKQIVYVEGDQTASTPELYNLFTAAQVTEISLPFKEFDTPAFQRIYRIYFNNYDQTQGLLNAISQFTFIDFAERVPLKKLFDSPPPVYPNDPSVTGPSGMNSYQLGLILAYDAFDCHKGGNAIVAIVDDAVQTSHEDLSGNIIAGWDAADLDADANPPFSGINAASASKFSHGTHVSGIAGAVTNNTLGVASIGWNNKIMPVKCTKNTTSSTNSVPYGYDGIVWASTHGAHVINMSWGGTAYSQAEYMVVKNARSNYNVILVAAAGNSYSANPLYPAAYGEGTTGQSWELIDKRTVIAVASVDANGDQSFWGSFFYGNAGSNFGPWVDVASYGTDIYSTVAGSSGGGAVNNHYGLKTGTSMASPLVAGLAGLMRSYKPSATDEEIIDCMIFSANPDIYDPIQHPGNVPGTLGSGRIDAFKAIRCLSTNCGSSCGPVAVIGYTSSALCPGGSVTLTANPGTQYLWSTSQTTQSITVTATGTYTVVVTFPGGCTASATISVNAADTDPEILVYEQSGALPNDGKLCGQDFLFLTAYYGNAYKWNAFGMPICKQQSLGPINAGSILPFTWNYAVTITDAGGCPGVTKVVTGSATWSPYPVVNISLSENSQTPNDGIVCAGSPVTLSASGGGTYSWGGYGTTAAITVYPTATTTYTVTVTNAGTCSATKTITIQVISCGGTCTPQNLCLDFDGIDDYVDVPCPLNTSALQNNFTVGCWIRDDRTPGGPPSTNLYRIFGFLLNQRFELGDRDGFLTFYSPGTSSVVSTTTIRDGFWHYISAVKSGALVTIYLDGATVPGLTGLNAGTFSGISQNFHIGDWGGTGSTPRFWQGRIDEFKVWGSVLTPAQIQDAMLCSADPTNANLLVHFTMDQGIAGGNNSGVTTAFNDGTSADGTLSGFALNGTASNWVARGRDRLPNCSVQPYSWIEGDPGRNFSGRTKVYDADIYTAGTEINSNSINLPSFTRRRADGSIVWRTKINLQGTINDFVQTDEGCYLLVGHTPVFSGDNKSFIALIDQNGVLVWLKQFNIAIRESFSRIIRSANPSNSLFPYTISGIRNNGGVVDDILLLTVNNLGNIGWMHQIGGTTDDEFRMDLLEFNGNNILAGSYVNGANLYAVLYRTDNTGAQLGSVQYQANTNFFDTETSADGQGIIIAGQITNGGAILARVNAAGSTVWAREFPDITLFRKLVIKPNGDIYAVGQRKDLTKYRNVIVKVQDLATGPVVKWQKHLERPGEINWVAADLVQYSGNNMFFTDSRINNPNGFGNEDIAAVMYNFEQLPDNCPVTREDVVAKDLTLTPAALSLTNVSVTPPVPQSGAPWAYFQLKSDSICKNDCACKFEKLIFRQKGTPLSVSVDCGNQIPVSVPCPGQYTPIQFSGKLICTGSCGFSGLNWTLTNPVNTVVGSGSATSGTFYVNISLTMAQVPGIYTLKLTGMCGTKICVCEIKFKMAGCPPPCSCDPVIFNNEVLAGFNWVQFPNCKFGYTPLKLTACDMVEWKYALSGTNNFTVFANTTGNQIAYLTFPNSGQYVVCYTVKRQVATGITCTLSRCWTFDVDCTLFAPKPGADNNDLAFQNNVCENSVIDNSGFIKGAEAGGLADEGSAWNWNYAAGSPEVVLDSGKYDLNFMRMRGNGGFSDLLYQDSLPIPNGRIQIAVAFRPVPGLILPGTELVVRVSAERQDSLPCDDPSGCKEVMRLAIPETDSLIWLLAGAYDSTAFNGRFLTIHIENPFSSIDVADQSTVDVDNICLRYFNFVSVEDHKGAALNVKLAPNPTSGFVRIDFDQPLPEKSTLRLYETSGRLIRTNTINEGDFAYSLNLNEIASGLYFIEIQTVSGGVWRGKIVKQ